MHHRLGVALLGSVIAVVAVAPQGAPAAPARAKLRISKIDNPPSPILAGSSAIVGGTVRNGGARLGTGTMSFSLRGGPRGTSARSLGSLTLRKVKPRASKRFSKRVRVPAGTKGGSYQLRVCVKVVGRPGTPKCRTAARRITVNRPNRPTPAPTPAPTPPPSAAQRVADATTAGELTDHLRALQAVADAHGGTRASGTPGYAGSVAYVKQTLEAAGYAVTTQPFSFPFFQELGPASLEQVAPGAKSYPVQTPTYSGGGSVTALAQAVDVELDGDRSPAGNGGGSGCQAADFAGFTAGRVAIVQRGDCTLEEKVDHAEAAGAVAVVVFNQGDTLEREGPTGGLTLGTPQAVPVVTTTFAAGAELADGAAETVKVTTSTISETRQTSNVLAETPGGDAERVVVVGAHLDSVLEGPGINDNGTGTALLLELAEQHARQGITPKNKVRFAFFGAEEHGLLGSEHHVGALSAAQRRRIAVNLNFDMLGSPNYIRYVYDGDASDVAEEGVVIPEGSAQAEQAFLDYFKAAGLATAPTSFDGRSDYGPFIAVGIPAGGLFSGAEEVKTQQQAAIFGGIPDVEFDPNYHEAGDTINNVSQKGLEELGKAAAYVSTQYATEKELVAPVLVEPRAARARAAAQERPGAAPGR